MTHEKPTPSTLHMTEERKLLDLLRKFEINNLGATRDSLTIKLDQPPLSDDPPSGHDLAHAVYNVINNGGTF